VELVTLLELLELLEELIFVLLNLAQMQKLFLVSQ